MVLEIICFVVICCNILVDNRLGFLILFGMGWLWILNICNVVVSFWF